MRESIIKIFVSHRIDQESTTIDNPLYVNVRCGATFDKRPVNEINNMIGDDTGAKILVPCYFKKMLRRYYRNIKWHVGGKMLTCQNDCDKIHILEVF